MSSQPGSGGRPTSRPAAAGVTVSALSSVRCRELLEGASVGRVGWSAAHGPQIFPVSYAWCDELVMFRTSPFGVISELTRRTLAVFEVDDLDAAGHSGWTVLGRGYAQAVAAPASLRRLWAREVSAPWANGIRDVVIGIDVTQLTGRSFHPVEGGSR